jgi:hypothetical protein
MSRPLVDPDLAAVTAALLEAKAQFVVIGGFAVIANSLREGAPPLDFTTVRDDHPLPGLDNRATDGSGS